VSLYGVNVVIFTENVATLDILISLVTSLV